MSPTDRAAHAEAALRVLLASATGCSPLDVQAIPGRLARVEITLTPEAAELLVRILEDRS